MRSTWCTSPSSSGAMHRVTHQNTVQSDGPAFSAAAALVRIQCGDRHLPAARFRLRADHSQSSPTTATGYRYTLSHEPFTATAPASDPLTSVQFNAQVLAPNSAYTATNRCIELKNIVANKLIHRGYWYIKM